MLSQDVKQRINTARQILVGKVPDPKAQVEQITTALIYKFMDDMDQQNEMLGGKPQFFIEELKEFSWRRLMSSELSGQERWDLYTRALAAFSKSERVPELFRTIFKDAYLPYRDPETLNLFLKVIDEFTYDHSEELGNAYEYLLSILSSQGDAGQFRTPRHIIDFIVEVVAPKKENTILDPACGTAGFLISAYKHIWRHNSSNFDEKKYIPTFAESAANDASSVEVQKNGGFKGDKLTPDDRKRLAKNIVGYDISPDMVRLSLVNMYLHGFATPKIYEYDTLTYEDRWDETFDIIFANPPFMTPKGGIRPHKKFQVQANRAEVLFVDYIAEHLNINGKAGIIVPEGIIFQSARAYKNLRKNLVENWGLYAVVSLPPGVFQPYSGVKTSILFIDKALSKKTDEILFVKVENDGFDLGAQRRRIDKNDLPEAYEILKKWQRGEKSDSKLALWVKKEKLAEGGEYNLTGDRYRETVDYSKVKWPMVKLGEVLDYEQPTNYIVRSTKYSDKYKIPVLTAGKSFILGYTNETEGIFPSEKLPVIIFDDFTTANRYVDFPFKVKSSAMKILYPQRDSKIDLKFVFYMMQNINFTPQQHKRYWISQYSQIPIPLPPLEVQKQIVAELDSYQKIIDGARQVIENWKPKIKIDPSWPKVKLGEVCDVNPSLGDPVKLFGDTELVYIDITSVKNNRGGISFENIIKTKEAPSRARRIVQENDVLISTVRPNLQAFAILKNIPKKIIASTGFAVLRCKDRIIPEFLYNVVFEDFVLEQMLQAMGKGAYPSINQNDVKNILIPLPPLEIQKQIVANIEKEQKIIDQLKDLIKIYEQKIKDKISEVWGEEK